MSIAANPSPKISDPDGMICAAKNTANSIMMVRGR